MDGIRIIGNQLIQFFTIGGLENQLCTANRGIDTGTGNLQFAFIDELIQISDMSVQMCSPTGEFCMSKSNDIVLHFHSSKIIDLLSQIASCHSDNSLCRQVRKETAFLIHQ